MLISFETRDVSTQAAAPDFLYPDSAALYEIRKMIKLDPRDYQLRVISTAEGTTTASSKANICLRFVSSKGDLIHEAAITVPRIDNRLPDSLTAWRLVLPDCNLYNGAGLPASPFRTDDWPGITRNAK